MTAPTKPDWAHALAGSLAADVTLAYHHADGMRDAVHAIASALRSAHARGRREALEEAEGVFDRNTPEGRACSNAIRELER